MWVGYPCRADLSPSAHGVRIRTGNSPRVISLRVLGVSTFKDVFSFSDLKSLALSQAGWNLTPHRACIAFYEILSINETIDGDQLPT